MVLIYYITIAINKFVNRGGSYIDSPHWIKNQRVTINQKNDNDKYFQYAAMVALNYGEIKWNPEKVPNIKSFKKNSVNNSKDKKRRLALSCRNNLKK